MGKTLYEKIWDSNLVKDGGSPLLYVDRHLVHEVTSPQAFAGLRFANRKLRAPNKTFATMDHNTSTKSASLDALSPEARIQVETLTKNCADFNVELYDIFNPNQGIVHVIGPELGITLPGTIIVCGDSHTATHGAFGALAFGIGTSEVEHVLATQTIRQHRAKTMKIEVTGKLSKNVFAKDLVLAIIGTIGNAGGTGYIVEFCGEAITDLSMDARMTVCNMAIEMGARGGMIAPDETTYQYLKGRKYAPTGTDWDEALAYWKTLKSDIDAKFDKVITIDANKIAPQVTWGSNPSQVVGIDSVVPEPNGDLDHKAGMEKALTYMDLKPNTPITDIKINNVFIGSCTNSRLEDLQVAAAQIKGLHVASHVKAIVVPGSGIIKAEAERLGLDKIFIDAGFEWRLPGCSMCLAMNDDKLNPGDRCAATSNRNFEGRQGRGSRTHLVSPAMAAAAAIAGHFVDIRK